MMHLADQGSEYDLGDEARAELAELIDRQMSPLGLAAMDALVPRPGHTVLDVGCGAGQTVMQLADRVGTHGRVIGVDIGQRVLAVARVRTANLSQVTLLQEDAAALDLPEGSVDGIYSRFGMMFFDDPVAALSNMRRMLKRGGRIGFVCWRSIQENELDFVPLNAANLAIPIDDAPFSFERSDTIEALLESSGFGDVTIEAVDKTVSSGGIEAMLNVLTRVGALGKILRNNPVLLSEALPRVTAALADHEREGQVGLKAATWIVTATAT